MSGSGDSGPQSILDMADARFSLSLESLSSGESLTLGSWGELPTSSQITSNINDSDQHRADLERLLHAWYEYPEFDLREDPPSMDGAYGGWENPRAAPPEPQNKPQNVQPAPRQIDHAFPPHLQGHVAYSSTDLTNGEFIRKT